MESNMQNLVDTINVIESSDSTPLLMLTGTDVSDDTYVDPLAVETVPSNDDQQQQQQLLADDVDATNKMLFAAKVLVCILIFYIYAFFFKLNCWMAYKFTQALGIVVVAVVLSFSFAQFETSPAFLNENSSTDKLLKLKKDFETKTKQAAFSKVLIAFFAGIIGCIFILATNILGTLKVTAVVAISVALALAAVAFIYFSVVVVLPFFVEKTVEEAKELALKALLCALPLLCLCLWSMTDPVGALLFGAPALLFAVFVSQKQQKNESNDDTAARPGKGEKED